MHGEEFSERGPRAPDGDLVIWIARRVSLTVRCL
jgi:hypothetical protein